MALVLKLVQDALNEPDVRAGITSGMVDCHENLRLSGIHTHTEQLNRLLLLFIFCPVAPQNSPRSRIHIRTGRPNVGER